jgi:prefoldin subunit 5
MDTQILLNAAFGLIIFLGGWLIKITFSHINRLKEEYDELYDQLQGDYRKLSNDMHEIALSLPEKYVAKRDLDKLIELFNNRFDKLENKIDQIRN